MRPFARSIDAAVIAFLAVWAGASIMVGVVAATAFPIVKDLDPVVPQLAQYAGDHWRIVAGRILNTAFHFADIIGAAAYGLAFLALILGLLTNRTARKPLAPIRYGAFVALGVVTFYALFSLRPEMQSHLDAYWQAASNGENDAARSHQQGFNELHSPATYTMTAQLLLMLACILLTAAAPTRDAAARRHSTNDPEPA